MNPLLLLQKIVLFALLALFCSCAQVVSPTGGLKDVKPPVAVKYAPDSASIHFNAKEIWIDFDEFIQLKDVSQLIISPPLDKKPELKLKGKSLKISLESPLEKNTTYFINFGNAIADVTEGNTNEKLNYIFSTGSFIDSISLTGKVEYAFDHKTEKDMVVMLYSDINDSIPYKKIPNYFAKTRADGTFQINNIKQGAYKIFVLKDANSNYLFDSPEEDIGFSEELIHLKKNNTTQLAVFKEIPKRQFLKKATAIEYGHLQFIFNKPVEELKISALNFDNKKEWYQEEYNYTKDTVHYWLLNAADIDSFKLQVADKNGILDTVEIRAIKQMQEGGRGIKFKLIAGSNVVNKTLDLNVPVEIKFNHPIKSYNFDKFVISADSAVIVPEKFNQQLISDRKLVVKRDNSSNKAMMNWDENKNYELFIPPGAITDIFDLTNDSILISFKTPEIKNYGTLKLTVKRDSSIALKEDIIIQLLDERKKIVREHLLPDNNVISYEYLNPGKYELKLIIDSNKNGKWDTGNYSEKVQPEKTLFFSTLIEIRANWDLEQEWKTAFN